MLLEDTAHYAGLLLAPGEGFGLWPRLFLKPLGKKIFMHFGPFKKKDFWCLVGMARYAGQLLAPAEGFGRGCLCPLGKIDLPYILKIKCFFYASLIKSQPLINLYRPQFGLVALR